MCVFEEALGSNMGIRPDRQEPLCEAERKNQVLFRSMDEIFKEIRHGPLFDPQPEHKISEALAVLKADLQRQVDETVPSKNITVDLPEGLEELLKITDGVSGAGIPSETADTYLVTGLRGLSVKPGKAGDRDHCSIFWRDDWTVFAALELGGCNQHRQIYYVLCRAKHKEDNPVAWRIMDRNDIEFDVYGSLAEFLEHETVYIEETPGGHKQELVLYSDTYPTYNWVQD